MNQIQVTAIAHADVKGKIQNYIKIENGKDLVLINVGEKTYNAVKQLTEPVNEEPLKETKGGKK